MDLFSIKKLITPFLLPPGLFVLLLIICGVFLMGKKNRKTGLLILALGFLMWGAAMEPVSDMLLRGIERGLRIPGHLEGDVIILLGGGIRETAHDLSGTGVPSQEMMYRVVTAVRAQKLLRVPVIVSGGTGAAGRIPEGWVVSRFLRDLGVPEAMILMEDKSRDTSENARNTKIICDRFGYRKPLLITSGFHMRRSQVAFHREGVTVVPLPAHVLSDKPKKYTLTRFLPDADAMGCTAAVVRERLGLMFYCLGGK